MLKEFRTKPFVLEGVVLSENNLREVEKFLNSEEFRVSAFIKEGRLLVFGDKGMFEADLGDFLLVLPSGDVVVLKEEDFKVLLEEVW